MLKFRHFIYFLGIVFLLGFNACKTANSDAKIQVVEQSPLTYLVKKSNKANSKVLILMHGLGSDENDLFGFGKQFDDNWTVFSLRAPFDHTNGKFSWYKMNLQNGVKDRSIEDIETSIEKVKEFMLYAKNKYNLNKSDFYIGGFSQGSILSLYAGLNNPDIFKGMACFSGLLLDDLAIEDLDNNAVQNLNVFMSHGMLDNVISVEESRKAQTVLQNLNVKTTYKEYAERHTISRENLIDFIKWIKTL